MSEFLKKQWAVCIVGVIFIAMILYVIVDTGMQKLPSKTVDGKDVVFSIDGENITADDLYDTMFNDTDYGIASVYQQIEKIIVEQTVETTEDITSEAKIQADYVLSSYKSNYGDNYLNYLETDLKALGYESADDLQNYFIYYFKRTEFLKNYVNDNLDEYFTAYSEEKNPCLVSHILVKMSDPSNPTDEEKAKMQEIDDLLNSGTSFGEVAFEHSDDSSASNNGLLGYADSDTSYVTEFKNVMLETEEGQISEWFMSEYGYHRIYINSRNVEDFKDYDEFYSALESYYPTLQISSVWKTAQELGITIEDETVRTRLLEYMGLNEE